MVRDLDLPLEIVGVPTVREADGLAMSSRNAYLSPDQRRVAPALHPCITRVAAAVTRRRPRSTRPLPTQARGRSQRRLHAVDYLEVRDAETLKPPQPGTQRPLRVLAAAWLGKTRLIDNVAIDGGNPV